MSLLESHFAPVVRMLDDKTYLTRLYNGCLDQLKEDMDSAWILLRREIEYLELKILTNEFLVRSEHDRNDPELSVNRFLNLYDKLRGIVHSHDWSKYPNEIPLPLSETPSTYLTSYDTGMLVGEIQKIWSQYKLTLRKLSVFGRKHESDHSQSSDELPGFTPVKSQQTEPVNVRSAPVAVSPVKQLVPGLTPPAKLFAPKPAPAVGAVVARPSSPPVSAAAVRELHGGFIPAPEMLVPMNYGTQMVPPAGFGQSIDVVGGHLQRASSPARRNTFGS